METTTNKKKSPYLDASYKRDGAGRAFQTAETDPADKLCLQFGVGGHGLFVTAVIETEPHLALHPFDFDRVPPAVIQRFTFEQELARLPIQMSATVEQLKRAAEQRNHLVGIRVEVDGCSQQIVMIKKSS